MAHDLVTELLQYSSLACFMPIWQLCANRLIPNCLRSNLSYSPLAALELYVKIANIQCYYLLLFQEVLSLCVNAERDETKTVNHDRGCYFRLRENDIHVRSVAIVAEPGNEGTAF